MAAMWKARWEPFHVAREQERQEVKLAACREVGELDDRAVLTLGAVIYWCEGSKDKIYRRQEKVRFINSDPALIAFFLRFLQVAGVRADQIRYRLHIHETADVDGAARWWAELAGVPVEEFQKPTIKRHRAKTNRKNLLDEYRGCLQVSVNNGADLYRRIEGWAFGTLLGEEAARAYLRHRSDAALAEIVGAPHARPN
ncbi:hypothetical protein DMH08_33295 [Actinomadura sp. WAC 06369]|nr:hypothetical protein DMH08_33295 [Actinomadura sp. WAC 06369]